MKHSNSKTAILGSCVILLVAACSSASQTETYKGALQFPKNEVDVKTASHTINFGPGAALGENEKNSLEGFLMTQGVGYGDELVLDFAAGDSGAAAKMMAVGDFLKTRGYWVKYATQSGSVSNANTAVLKVNSYTAVPPDCQALANASFVPGELALNKTFGCVSAYNLAMMVANPKDLIEGQTHVPGNTYASVRAIQLYRSRVGLDHFTFHPQIKNDIKMSPESEDSDEAK